MSSTNWQSTVARHTETTVLLSDIFAATIGGYSELRERCFTASSERVELTDSSAGFLLKRVHSSELESRLHAIQWGFIGMTLTEWKAVVEHWLKDFVAEYLDRTSGRNATLEKKIFKNSSKWRDEILAITGADIGATSRLGWVTIREFIEIRNCLVHRGHIVDQEFLDRLSDVRLQLTYSYVLGKPFSLNPGEIFHLLNATEDFIEKTAALLS